MCKNIQKGELQCRLLFSWSRENYPPVDPGNEWQNTREDSREAQTEEFNMAATAPECEGTLYELQRLQEKADR